MNVNGFIKILIMVLTANLFVGCASLNDCTDLSDCLSGKDIREGVSEPQKLSKDGTTIDPRDNTTVQKKKKAKKLKPAKLTEVQTRG